MVLVHHPTTSGGGSLLERADLSHPIPENARKLAQLVEYDESRVELGTHSVFVREARPPGAHYAKATVIFLHGQSFSSSTWTENNMLRYGPRMVLEFWLQATLITVNPVLEGPARLLHN
ncbi:hypothetical protein B9Z55_016154 [Caenorhabditis nigoni]|uniref:Uncharacterized protein n=1 Tax=Caenorhabditis nigoni TaxID=1611254 RepID=A0A2G5UDY6_9PELO|nr:hypothetical protein B9Z55_016154 [Caenorhabditis nigoni]